MNNPFRSARELAAPRNKTARGLDDWSAYEATPVILGEDVPTATPGYLRDTKTKNPNAATAPTSGGAIAAQK